MSAARDLIDSMLLLEKLQGKPIPALGYQKWQLGRLQPVQVVKHTALGIGKPRQWRILLDDMHEGACFRNAVVVAMVIDDVQYVQGYQNQCEHAWNSYNGLHFDLTAERFYVRKKSEYEMVWTTTGKQAQRYLNSDWGQWNNPGVAYYVKREARRED